jgi:hypothetical protein
LDRDHVRCHRLFAGGDEFVQMLDAEPRLRDCRSCATESVIYSRQSTTPSARISSRSSTALKCQSRSLPPPKSTSPAPAHAGEAATQGAAPSPGTGSGENETTGEHDQTQLVGHRDPRITGCTYSGVADPHRTTNQFLLHKKLLATSRQPDDLATAFKTICTALDERNISYLQATLQLVGAAKTVDTLKGLLDQIGIQANMKDI